MGLREITREEYEDEIRGTGSMTASDTTRKPSMRGRFDIVGEAAVPEAGRFLTAFEGYGLDAQDTLRSFKRDLLGFNMPDDRESEDEYDGQGSAGRYREPEIRGWGRAALRNRSFPGSKESVLFTCSRSIDGTEEGFDSMWFLPDQSSPSGLGAQRRATHLEGIGNIGKYPRDIWVEKLVMRERAGWKKTGMQTDLLVIQTTLIGLYDMLTDMLGMTSNREEKRWWMVMGVRAFKADDTVLETIYGYLKNPELEEGEAEGRINKATFGSGSMGWRGTGQTKAVVRSSLAEGRWKW